LFSREPDCSTVAGLVRTNASLSDPLRRAAINLVLKRCSELREQARQQAAEAVDQALTYFDERRYDGAELLLIDALDTARRRLAPESVETVTLIMMRADRFNKQGRADEAGPYTAELASFRKRVADRRGDYPDALNGTAWDVVKDPSNDLPAFRSALLEAMLADELSDHENAMILDTLARAYHRTGHRGKAIENQKKALALWLGDSSSRTVMEARMAEYKAALKDEAAKPSAQ